jgi:hypothetical protein
MCNDSVYVDLGETPVFDAQHDRRSTKRNDRATRGVTVDPSPPPAPTNIHHFKYDGDRDAKDDHQTSFRARPITRAPAATIVSILPQIQRTNYGFILPQPYPEWQGTSISITHMIMMLSCTLGSGDWRA